MKILWITNIMMPPLCDYLGIKVPNSGGWMYSSLQELKAESCDMEFAVATYYSGKQLKNILLDDISYYLLPDKGGVHNYNKRFEEYWIKIVSEYKPDIVHLHGTELSHGLAFLKACPQVKTVVSIQGLVSVIAQNYLKGISFKDIFLCSFTINDLLRRSTFFNTGGFSKRGNIEKEIITCAKNIIGRTSWDKAHVWAINQNAKYYHCDETLRDIFYTKKWNYNNCKPHSIFISQGGYPIKGLHQVFKAMPLILREYPDAKIYIAGPNITKCNNLIQKLKLSGYGKYLRKLIKRYNIQENISFLGNLNEEQMCNQYLLSNVFVCPSSIENSPNSLAEAQLLGMPCIASYVGGIPDMMNGFEHWNYRFDEIEMLAKKICEIFEQKDGVRFNNNKALERHDKLKNRDELKSIYQDILSQDK